MVSTGGLEYSPWTEIYCPIKIVILSQDLTSALTLNIFSRNTCSDEIEKQTSHSILGRAPRQLGGLPSWACMCVRVRSMFWSLSFWSLTTVRHKDDQQRRWCSLPCVVSSKFICVRRESLSLTFQLLRTGPPEVVGYCQNQIGCIHPFLEKATKECGLRNLALWPTHNGEMCAPQ